MRTIDGRIKRLKTRFSAYGAIEGDALPPPPSSALKNDDAPWTHVVHFAAVQDHEVSPEVRIDGEIRGALSWSVARGLRGAADRNGDGVITREELERYVRENILLRSETRQHPQVRSGAPLDKPLLRVPAVADTAADASGSEEASLLIARVGGTSEDLVLAQLPGVVAVSDDGSADLLWDPENGEVLSIHGDVVAWIGKGEDSSSVTDLKRVVDKWLLVEHLKRLGERRTLRMRLLSSDPEPRGAPSAGPASRSDDRRYEAGEVFTVAVDGASLPYLTVFNLASNGRVDFLYPLARFNDPLTQPDGRWKIGDIEARDPFGADHIVAIASDRPPKSLHSMLVRLDGQMAAALLAKTLEGKLANIRYEIGIGGIYTAPKG
jgi:hypothetical protein